METLSRREFRKKHHCKSCLYYSKMRRCIAELICPLEIDTGSIKKGRTCPLDDSGMCPYGNEAGTCFGFCLKQLIKDANERKQEDEQAEEDKKDDG